MPITLTFTEGVLPVAKAKEAIAQITASFLKHHGMTGNKVMTRNLTAHVHIVPKGLTFSGGKEIDAAWLETRSKDRKFNCTSQFISGHFRHPHPKPIPFSSSHP
jgi:hypothetical protein